MTRTNSKTEPDNTAVYLLFESQAYQLLGGMIGISVSMFGKETVKKAFDKIAKASKKNEFWNAVDGMNKVVKYEFPKSNEYRKAKKVLDKI